MKTSEYVKKYNLNIPGQFDRNAFIADLSQEFEDRLTNTRIARESMHLEFGYNIFINLVKEIQEKFWNISKKKAGGEFTIGLWKHFYARTIIPARAKYFPEIHKTICSKQGRE